MELLSRFELEHTNFADWRLNRLTKVAYTRLIIHLPYLLGDLSDKWLTGLDLNQWYNVNCSLLYESLFNWQRVEVSIPIRLLAVPPVFKTELRAVAINPPYCIASRTMLLIPCALSCIYTE